MLQTRTNIAPPRAAGRKVMGTLRGGLLLTAGCDAAASAALRTGALRSQVINSHQQGKTEHAAIR
jgi:hypothetical protein